MTDTEPRHPGDKVACFDLQRGEHESNSFEIGFIAIQDYQDTTKAGVGRYKVAAFLPGAVEWSAGDTPKSWPEQHEWHTTAEAARECFDRYVRAARADGWIEYRRGS